MHSTPFDKIRYDALRDRGSTREIKELSAKIDDVNARLKERHLYTQILNTGSTAPSRGTFVADAAASYHDFRPDIDLNVVLGPKVERAAAIEDVEEALADLGIALDRGGHKYRDHTHAKDVYNAGTGNIVLSAAVFSPSREELAALRYNEALGEVPHDQRVEAKVLRLAFQRGAVYGSYNRGLSGICIDEMLRQIGDLQLVMRFLGAAASDPSKREVLHPITRKNLLASVSGGVWNRMKILSAHFLQSGEFPAHPMNPATWIELNPGRFAASSMILCGVESCGREPYQIATLLLQEAKPLLREFKLKGPLDFYLVPCAPSDKQSAHTSIYLSLPEFTHVSPVSVGEELASILGRIQDD